MHLNHSELGVFVADCDAQGRPVFTTEEIDRLIERTDADRVQLGHLTGRTWEIALEQLDEANRGIVIPSDTPPASARCKPSRSTSSRPDRRGGCRPTRRVRLVRRRPQIGSRPAVRSAGSPVASPENVRANLNRWALDEHAHDPIA